MKKRFLLFCLIFSLNIAFEANAIIEEKEKQKSEMTLSQKIDESFKPFVEVLSVVLFLDPFAAIGIYDPQVYDEQGNPVIKNGTPLKVSIPLVVVWLVFGAVFFTIRMKFINIRGFYHSLELVSGKFSKKEDKGEISSFQALSTALSATVGMGNIAGVAVAMTVGGAGAAFWMIVSAFLGMSSKFVECSLGVKYRQIDKNGIVHGGPMYYLKDGLKAKGLPKLGMFLSVAFAVMCIGGSVGGGNMLQSNQAFLQLASQVPAIKDDGFWFGLLIATLVGLVTIGGVKSIAKVTDKLVPFMCAFYILAGLSIILANITKVPEMFMLIIKGAFAPSAMYGGFLGVLIQGFRRASFSNEAGIGSSAIAHSPAKTNEPISEGVVAMLEPVVDTIIVCTMTALVLVITGAYQNPENLQGTALTSYAFGTVVSWFPYLLTVAVLLFAFSTILSWGYYGEMAWRYLFGDKRLSIICFKLMYLFFVILGASVNMNHVVEFSDMMILGMAFPNIAGLIILSTEVHKDMIGYFERVKK
ncbi:MAG: alanine/glycine:cation symporter family protein [Flammeovirgaceae bacterium]